MRLRRISGTTILLLASTTYAYWSTLKYVLAVFALLLVVKRVDKLTRGLVTWAQGRRTMSVDTMDGISFEHYVMRVLIDQGYKNVSLTEQYDYGVDIIAEKNGIRWGVQVKRYSGLVKAEAVRQVVTGLRLYSCDRAMVITNSTFSTVAKRLAESNDCVLGDSASLHAMVR